MAISDKNIYDKREIFESECRELLEELMLNCRLHGIPCFFTACVKNTPESSEYTTNVDEAYKDIDFINDAVCPGGKGINLTNDLITKCLAVTAGFNVVPKRTDLEISFDDIDDSDDDGMIFPGIDEPY